MPTEKEDPLPVRLSVRELQVLGLICQGHTSRQIASMLGLSFKTITTHRTKLFAKADVHTSIALFRWALLNGYITLEELADK